jgi:transcriptional regulator with XRE-family HTH domain
MNPEQARRLGQRLRSRREELGLTVRELERLAKVDNGTIVRIEQGAFAAPRPDKLSRMAEALRLPLADVFALAEYVVPDELPTFAPYLRAKYGALPARAVAEIERYFDDLSTRYGIDPAGPAPGEDEAPEAKPRKR